MPLADKKQVLRSPSSPADLAELANSAEVVLFRTPLCGFCRAAEALFRARGIEFREVDVRGNAGARQWLREVSGQRTVPQIFIRGRSIGGYSELAGLDQSGALAELLGEPSP